MTLDEILKAGKPARCRVDDFLYIYHPEVLGEMSITVNCVNCATCVDVMAADDPEVPQEGWEHYDAGRDGPQGAS